MAFELVGRDDDLASVCSFVEETGGGSGALVLEGEAGIGKSTLWLAGVEHARSCGLRVLVSRPAEAERGEAHVGLSDLFDDTLDEVAPTLSAPRRRALGAALLREEPSGDFVDHRALAVAVRDLLHLLAEREPILIAVDDVQWLDPASAATLAFALRRLPDSDVSLLVARRLVEGTRASGLEQALERERVRRLRLGPLSVGAVHQVLLDRLGRPFPRQTLLRIHEATGGNPFFALELARVLDVDLDPLEPLPVPETLDELVRLRLAGLPAATRDALSVASALGTPSRSLLERAGVVPDALEPAEAAQVIEYENGTVRFTHPLLSSVLYADLGGKRRTIHRRIAGIVDDPVARARHLALSSESPDAEVAAVLDEAATLANERGASAVAAELAEQALRLTPPNERHERHRRALAAVRAQRATGEWTRARAMVTDLLAETDIGELRAEALVLRAELEGVHRSVALLEEALLEAQARPALRARILSQLAVATRFEQGFDGALAHARAALELADELDDDALRVRALGLLTFFGCAVGDTDAPAHAARAHEIAAAGGDPDLMKEATNALAEVLEVRRDVDAARALLEPAYAEWHERDELWSAELLARLAWVELWGGRWQLAAHYAARALDINLQYGFDVPWNHMPIAVVAAHRGRLQFAREHSGLALRLGEEQIGLRTPVHLATMGLVELRSGDPQAAVAWFGESEATTTRVGWREAARRWWVADHAEALLELGRIDDAVRVVDVWEEDAARRGRDWVLAHVTRCRGLVAAARGEVDRAESLLQQAVAKHRDAGDPFGEARALLALGVVRRRRRQKRGARDAIEAALEGFEQLGAATWIEKARAELGRIGGRVREEGLTAAERRVADLVAEGRTNKEVAAALFLGERTVETHLSHVYAKLGVRSRAELARVYRPASGSLEQSSGGHTISS